MPEHSEHLPKPLKAGDRLWVTLDEPPSALETQIARQLTEFCRDTRFFYVQIFSWRSVPTPLARDVTSHLPKLTQTAQDRCIGFHEIGDAITVNVPMVALAFSNKGAAGDIRVSPRKFSFEDQLLIVVGCRQADYDSGHASLRGAMDAIGYLSLVFGKQISDAQVLSAYFDIAKRKFVDGTLGITLSSPVDDHVFGIKSYFKLGSFLGDDARTHAALWFAGKAFTEQDRASRTVFYHTAIEVICGKRPQDHFRSLYRGMPHAESAIKAVRRLQDLRNDLVHKGTIGDFGGSMEREVQALLLDALIAKQCGKLPESAFQLLSAARQKAGS